MRSSSNDAASGSGGTGVRLAVSALLGALLLLSSTVELTGALLTDSTQTTTVVSTMRVFPTPTPTPTAG